MKITEVLEGGFTFSAELLPPKGGFGIEAVLHKVSTLKDYIDFVSVTMGAAGSRKRYGTLSLSYLVKHHYNIECIPHLTCLNTKKADIKEKVFDMHNLGLENILALKGDLPDSEIMSGKFLPNSKQDFQYASNLVSYLSDINNFCIGVAAYPEGYDGSRDIEHAAKILKAKQDAGADFAITQMVFDANVYSQFVERAQNYGVNIPIIPGVRPIKSYKQGRYIVDRFKVSIPFINELTDKNIEYALQKTISLCKKLKSAGAPGIHFFTINDGSPTKKIIQEMGGRKI